MKEALCGVCNQPVPLHHCQIMRKEADGSYTSYHMSCEYPASKVKPCEDCGHHKSFCTDCAEPTSINE